MAVAKALKCNSVLQHCYFRVFLPERSVANDVALADAIKQNPSLRFFEDGCQEGENAQSRIKVVKIL